MKLFWDFCFTLLVMAILCGGQTLIQGRKHINIFVGGETEAREAWRKLLEAVQLCARIRDVCPNIKVKILTPAC